jgi:hypothetical protein
MTNTGQRVQKDCVEGTMDGLALLDKSVDELGADESGRAGDKDVHGGTQKMWFKGREKNGEKWREKSRDKRVLDADGIVLPLETCLPRF